MRCSDTTRLWLRTAIALRENYRQLTRPQVLPSLPSPETLRQRLSRWKWARNRQLTAAVRQSRIALEQSLRSTIHALTSQLEILQKPERTVPSIAQLFAEIAALQDEFEHVSIDLRQRRLTVTTERIVLEDLDLGPFEIQLQINRLAESSPYTVTAVDPDQSSAGHPHPHVSGQSLCEGDGKQAIAAALANGLISEFFVLVRQILRTYNPGSAYRTLDEWHGVDCAACGDLVPSEDRYCCDLCLCSLCSDCEYRCENCHSSLCHECSQACEECRDHFCPRCITCCADCAERFCEKCLTTSRCPDCLELEMESSPNDQPEKEDHDLCRDCSPPSTTEIHAERVGQTPVSA